MNPTNEAKVLALLKARILQEKEENRKADEEFYAAHEYHSADFSTAEEVLTRIQDMIFEIEARVVLEKEPNPDFFEIVESFPKQKEETK